MPNMNGCEVCRKVKGSPETSDIPMLFLTGKGDPEDVVEGFEAGVSDYVKGLLIRLSLFQGTVSA